MLLYVVHHKATLSPTPPPLHYICWYPFLHLGGEVLRVQCFNKEHNTVIPNKAGMQTAQSGDHAAH